MSSWLVPGFNKVCEPVRVGTPSADRLAAACWWFFASKITELFDTVSHLFTIGLVPAEFELGFTPRRHSTETKETNTQPLKKMWVLYFLAS